MLTNPRDAFTCQSRSPNMVPFNVVSCRCSIVTLSLRSAVSAIFDFKNVVALKSGSEVNHDVKRKRRVVFFVVLRVCSSLQKTSGRWNADERPQKGRRKTAPTPSRRRALSFVGEASFDVYAVNAAGNPIYAAPDRPRWPAAQEGLCNSRYAVAESRVRAAQESTTTTVSTQRDLYLPVYPHKVSVDAIVPAVKAWCRRRRYSWYADY